VEEDKEEVYEEALDVLEDTKVGMVEEEVLIFLEH
jgi:hypothetical protein